MITVTISQPDQEFTSRISGVTQRNSDGSNRQDLLKKIYVRDSVKLIREQENPHDKFAIAVANHRNETLGYMPAGDRRLAEHIDRGGAIEAYVVEITGGPTFFQKLFGKSGKSYGCVVKITKGDFNWKAAEPWMKADKKISDILKSARTTESENPTKAIGMYRKAISSIVELDSLGPAASAWRTANYPINRLSILLDKHGLRIEALEEIQRWNNYGDRVGIPEADSEAVKKRMERLRKAI